MTVRIRPMTRDDKPEVIRLLRTLPEFEPPEVAVAEEVIDSYLDNPSGSGYYIQVAEAGSRVAGYICYGPAPLTEGTWDVYWLAVSTEKQGKGIGSALMTFAEDEIRRAEGRLIIIETSSKPGYQKTRRFYLNRGYRIVGCLSDFYAPGDDKLTHQKRLK
ncbi:MAG TPA: GNAT family N-acetyltransferase [Dehalococcoidia bacterium]|nr:GNAT family N-acetyltransferase [Dehalococcoidia bacterium]